MSSTTAQEARPKRRSAADRKAKAQARLQGGNSPAIRPGMQGGQYRPLNDDALTRIHEAALTILEHTGIGDPLPQLF
jgi:trimethylamine--corrinoid protein Co-methyltransferase